MALERQKIKQIRGRHAMLPRADSPVEQTQPATCGIYSHAAQKCSTQLRARNEMNRPRGGRLPSPAVRRANAPHSVATTWQATFHVCRAGCKSPSGPTSRRRP